MPRIMHHFGSQQYSVHQEILTASYVLTLDVQKTEVKMKKISVVKSFLSESGNPNNAMYADAVRAGDGKYK